MVVNSSYQHSKLRIQGRFFFLLLITLNIFSAVYAQDTETKNFQVNFGAKFLSRFTAYGIDLAEENSALAFSSALSHGSGISFGSQFTQPLGDDGDLYRWSVGFAYEKEIFSALTLTAGYDHYFYSSDSINILSPYSNAISLAADMDLTLMDIGISFDRFLGSSGATYFGLDVSTFIDVKPFYILPIVQITLISQTVSDQVIPKIKGRKKDAELTSYGETTFTGFSSTITSMVIVYPIGDNFYASFVPTAIWSHQEELSADPFSFVWSAGIRYRHSF